MNKCPKCQNVLPVPGKACDSCGFAVSEEATKPLFDSADKTGAAPDFSEKNPDAERWQKIKKLFNSAQELTPNERKEFLEKFCGGDIDLRREVEKLLESFENVEGFMEKPAVAEAASMFENGKIPGAGQAMDDSNHGGFIAGTVLANRYRIIGLLGKGGMGEVYQAEDIKLNQTVALKFLPNKLEKDRAALDGFISEVRTARQVSHPNVCRVFDIG